MGVELRLRSRHESKIGETYGNGIPRRRLQRSAGEIRWRREFGPQFLARRMTKFILMNKVSYFYLIQQSKNTD